MMTSHSSAPAGADVAGQTWEASRYACTSTGMPQSLARRCGPVHTLRFEQLQADQVNFACPVTCCTASPNRSTNIIHANCGIPTGGARRNTSLSLCRLWTRLRAGLQAAHWSGAAEWDSMRQLRQCWADAGAAGTAAGRVQGVGPALLHSGAVAALLACPHFGDTPVVWATVTVAWAPTLQHCNCPSRTPACRPPRFGLAALLTAGCGHA